MAKKDNTTTKRAPDPEQLAEDRDSSPQRDDDEILGQSDEDEDEEFDEDDSDESDDEADDEADDEEA